MGISVPCPSSSTKTSLKFQSVTPFLLPAYDLHTQSGMVGQGRFWTHSSSVVPMLQLSITSSKAELFRLLSWLCPWLEQPCLAETQSHELCSHGHIFLLRLAPTTFKVSVPGSGPKSYTFLRDNASKNNTIIIFIKIICPNFLFTYTSFLKALKRIDNYHSETMSFAHTEATGTKNLLKKSSY